ncbi:MAG: 4-alpha-glucanotransferase [Bacillota bacterium]
MTETQIRQLHQLAQLYGVETAYYNVTGLRQQAAPHALLAVLRALGAPVEKRADVCAAIRERRRKKLERRCEPVAVTWDGEPLEIEVRLPVSQAGVSAECVLELEDGAVRRWTCHLADLSETRAAQVEGDRYVVKQLRLPPGLPWGYHRFTLTLPDAASETLVIAAPRQAYTSLAGPGGKTWGVFIPLYALHSARSWGAGDFGDLQNLLDWVRERGGSLVGTLPLLAAFLDEPFEPSPYLPVSRLFWNEFYLDVTRIPELDRCPAARDLLSSPAVQHEIAALRDTPLVDYRRTMAVKRRVLEHLSRCCFSEESGRQADLRRWAAEHPAAQDYARFRATAEMQRSGWPAWPDRLRAGVLREEDRDPDAERYHLYVQWLADEQLKSLAEQARQGGPGLYLDLPLGVHSGGYDVWRERAAFALEASTGAPPDPFFSEGQNWGFPPLHPERIREQGYRYYIACLRNHLRHARVLRLDHVMGLHRLFWIPEGVAAREGVYVRYQAEEFYAILSLESHRHQAVIVGEDLGTVPHCVRTAMGRHKINRMYVLPFELTGNPGRALHPIPADALASLNTHDMPPFAAFWSKEPPKMRSALTSFLRSEGWLEAENEDPKAILRACLAYLSAGPARIVLVNLEDLWLEAASQNVPGTAGEHPSWRRKARHAFEEFSRMPEVLQILQEIDYLRRNTYQ